MMAAPFGGFAGVTLAVGAFALQLSSCSSEPVAPQNPAPNAAGMAVVAPALTVTVEHPLAMMNVEGQDYSAIRYTCTRAMALDLVVYSRHPQVIRTLFRGKAHESGEYTIQWDGRDEFGEPASDGYYFLKASETAGGVVLFDSADSRWGAPLSPTEVNFVNDGSFSYHVPSNAVIRAGAAIASSGAYCRTFLDWVPRPVGHHNDHWSGYDSQGRIALLGHMNLKVYVRAYSLPEATLFVAGSTTNSVPVRREGETYVVPPEDLGEVSPFATQEESAARTPVFTLHVRNDNQAHIDLQGAELTESVEIHIGLHPDTQQAVGGYSVKAYVDEELFALAEPADAQYSFFTGPRNVRAWQAHAHC